MKRNKYHFAMSLLFAAAAIFWIIVFVLNIAGLIAKTPMIREGFGGLFKKMSSGAVLYASAAGICTSLLSALFHKWNSKALIPDQKTRRLKEAAFLAMLVDTVLFYFVFFSFLWNLLPGILIYLYLAGCWILATAAEFSLLIAFRHQLLIQTDSEEGSKDGFQECEKANPKKRSKKYHLMMSLLFAAATAFWFVYLVIHVIQASYFIEISQIKGAAGIVASALFLLYHRTSLSAQSGQKPLRRLRKEAFCVILAENVLFYTFLAVNAVKELSWTHSVFLVAFLFFFTLCTAAGSTLLILYRHALKKEKKASKAA